MQQSLKQWLKDLQSQGPARPVTRSCSIHTEPLDKQIDRWLAETPPALLIRPWSMCELQKLFVGQYRQHPHAQHIASELRKRGWYTRRVWTQPGYGQRLWFAPRQNSIGTGGQF
jgi:hypothetical protein